MSLADIVSVAISTDTVGVTAAGFGVPLILSHKASFAERVRFYTKASDILTDGFLVTDPEYLAAQKLLGAATKVEQFALGRCANKPTQAYKISLAAVTAGAAYGLRLGATAISITAGAGTFAVNDYIISQLVSACAATATAAGFTAAAAGPGGSQYMTITANTPGAWLAVEVDDVALLLNEQTHADPGLAADLAAIALEDSSWYGLVSLFNSHAVIDAVAAWTEANEKLYAAASCESAIATTALAGATDVMTSLKTAGYARTACIYHPAPDQFADAAWLGKCLPYDPGEETWAFKTLAGVDATTLTTTHITNIQNKYGNYYAEVAGVNVTLGKNNGGVVSANEYVDVVRFRDWLKARIAERIFARLAGNAKIPFTDAGIAVIEGEIRGQLDEGIKVGGISPDPAPTVTVPKAADVSAADKSARHLRDVEFEATLAGAIHKITIEGVLSI